MAKSATPPKKTCFVVGPIGKEGSEVRTHSDWLYEGIIKPAFDGFAEFEKPIRADMIAQPGMITTQVIEHLLDDDLVIADLSLANPNAFYEIGIRHMVQKPIVHMQLKGEPEPFDTSGFRAVKFALRHPSDLVEAKRDLAAAVKEATTLDHRVENPVTHARGAIRLEQTATPEQKVILDEIRNISGRLNALEDLDHFASQFTVPQNLLLQPSSKIKQVTVLEISHGLMDRASLEVLKEYTKRALNSHGIFLTMNYYEPTDNELEVTFDGLLQTSTLSPAQEQISTHDAVIGTRVFKRHVKRSN